MSNQRPLLFAFDGSDSSSGPFGALIATAVDEDTGNVYAINALGAGKGSGGVCKFNADGEAQVFLGGKSCLGETPSGPLGFGFYAGIAIDNSGGLGGPEEGEQGRIFVSEEGGPVHAFAADGTWLWTLDRTVASPCGIAVDDEGRLLVGNGTFKGEATDDRVLVFDATGKAPPSTTPIDEIPMTNGSKAPCRLAIDQSGKGLYVGLSFSGKGSPGVDKYLEGIYDSTLTTVEPREITIDQSQQSGHVFVVDDEATRKFAEFEPCEAAKCKLPGVPGSPFGGDLIGAPRGLAYNPYDPDGSGPEPPLDWVYVSDRASNTVKVFGPAASGTVPDVSCGATDTIALHSATARCTINPLSLPNAYHCEWKAGTGANWGTAVSSTEKSIEPADSSPHAVSCALEKLKSNTSYQVRLVGTNAEPDKLLSAYSAPDTFTTLKPPAPGIEDCEISEIDTDSAHVACEIEPYEEETAWQVERSSDPDCEGGFAKEPTQTIAEGAPGTVEVEWDLEGLYPAQHYCVRVSATGPGDTTTTTKADFAGGIDEFSTDAIPPSQASLAFAAPRTDTAARLNARVNPEGEVPLTYRFEWSEDGANWNALPERVSTSPARDPIVLGEELGGLEPDTTYHYRLGLAKNEAGMVPPLAEERTFTTRSSAEVEAVHPASCPNEEVRQKQHTDGYLASCRGIELVNDPDKGNQNALGLAPTLGTSPLAADGEKVIWLVLAGAPGAPNGTLGTLLAERTGGGWGSESLPPPAAEQFGGGGLAYRLTAATPDLEGFVFNAAASTTFAQPEPPNVVRRRRGEPEQLLKPYGLRPVNLAYESMLDLSDDAKHVVFPDIATGQLEDIGDPAQVEVVSLMPDGSESSCGLELGDGRGFGNGFQQRPGYHAIATTDASRVYFGVKPNKVGAPGVCEGSAPMGLYVRDRAAAKTTLIDPGLPGQAPEFIRATPDGRAAYFLTRSKLDPDDTNSGGDIYRYDEAAKASRCLTCEAAPDAEVAGRAMVSDDFSHLYFESEEKLLTGQGKAGDNNLYSLSGGELRYVARTIPEGQLSILLSNDVRLSADGSVLLLRARASRALSSDATSPTCVEPNNQEQEPCRELYRYEEGEGSLECVSCDPQGATTHNIGSPAGRTDLDYRLSADGSTIAFATQEALLEDDVNQDTDIYEWRGGSLGLVTDGVSDFQVQLTAPQVLGIDEDGANILFGLVPPGGSLTGFERDELLNLYDARVGGGFEPPSPKAHCTEDSCQGPLLPAPSLPAGGGGGFHGQGNEKGARRPRRCAKGKARRHGRCAKRRQKHRKRAHAKHRRAAR